jgi:alanine dehydrogenase
MVSASISLETLEETLDIRAKGAKMHIGIPRESGFQENRIALIPDAVEVLINNGHEVIIESKAGAGSKYSDRDYAEAGARIILEKAEVFKAPIIIKSAPIMDDELPLLQLNQTIISPIHVPVLKKGLLEELVKKKVTAIGFEYLKDDSGTYPIVRSMSEIAGSAAMLVAGQYEWW